MEPVVIALNLAILAMVITNAYKMGRVEQRLHDLPCSNGNKMKDKRCIIDKDISAKQEVQP